MIKSFSLHNGHHINTNTFVRAIEELKSNGFEPVIYNLSKELSKVFWQNFKRSRYYTILYENRDHSFDDLDDLALAECFVKDGFLYIWFYQSEFHDELNPFSYIYSGMTIYVIGEESRVNVSLLKDFGEIISKVCLKSKHFKSYLENYELKELNNWNAQSYSSIKEPELYYEYESSKINNFEEAKYSVEEVELAHLFSDKDVKAAIRLLAKNVKLREEDLFEEFGDNKANNILKALKTKKAISTEKLISCRKTNKFIAKIPESVDSNDFPNLRCANCNRFFKDESVTKVFSLTDITKSLLKSSHWMTVLVTELLVQSGVDLNEIIWSLSNRSDEIDIAFKHKNQLYVVELKDSDFEIGHAYALNYRALKFEADQAIVIATGNISDEAKELFENVYDKYSEQIEYSDDSFVKKRRLALLISNFDGSIKSLNEFSRSSQLDELDDITGRFRSITSLNLGPIIYGFDEEE